MKICAMGHDHGKATRLDRAWSSLCRQVAACEESGNLLTCLVGIMIPIFSTALANSSGSTVPFPFKSKYLKDFLRTCSSEVMPEDFCCNLFFSSFSKLQEWKVWESDIVSYTELPTSLSSAASDRGSEYLPCFKAVHWYFVVSVLDVLFVKNKIN